MNCPHCQANNSAVDGPCFECGEPLVPVAKATLITKGSLIANRYQVLEVLGRGGMGVVYKAHDQLLDEIVAIKVLRRELIAEPEAAKRFRLEIKLARRVSHPNVCRIHEYGEDGELTYISMAYVEGYDLRRRLADFPEGLPADEAFDVAIQAARGLQAIHDAGVIHRDFKTPNMMRQPNGTIQLMDFGIAKETGQHGGGLTATGMVVGTPEFMSPEQCRGKPLDARSDVYSLGVVTFELFTGRVPFQGDSLMATLLKQLEELPPLQGPGAERLPPSVVPVLRKALAKAPEERYSTAIDVALALEQARAQPHAPAAAEAPGTAPTLPAAPASPSLPAPGPTIAVSRPEQRKSTRLELPLDISLKKLGPNGAVLMQERTLADNISRTGLRVMTSLSAIEPNDTVLVQEINGDFQAQARVRHRFLPSDGIWRLGLEFIDSEAPDRLVRTGSWTSTMVGRPRATPATAPTQAPARPASGTALPTPATPPPASAREPHPGRSERRSSSRLSIPLELNLERLGSNGEPFQHERTLAENVGRGGAQVLTATPFLAVGEIVRLTELGGDFQTRAAVRGAYTAPDRIRRLNLEFLDRQAPDRLVPAAVEPRGGSRPAPALRTPVKTPAIGSSPPRPVPAHGRTAGEISVPTPAPLASAVPSVAGRQEVLELFGSLRGRNHYEVLGLTRGASETEVRDAFKGLVRRYHPDAVQAAGEAGLRAELGVIMAKVVEAHEVLVDVQRRAKYEVFLGPERGPQASQAAKPASSPAAAEPPLPQFASMPKPGPDPARMLRQAHELFTQERYWDAIQELEAALPHAQSPARRHEVQVLLARAVLKNPKWLRRGEDLLLEVTREDPRHVEALMLLADIYRGKGLRMRAERLLHQVLELDPQHATAAEDLKKLVEPSPP